MTLLKGLFLIAVLSLAGEPYLASGQAGTPGSSTRGMQTLHSEVNLVEVDVTVVDQQGVPVKGLLASDFEVRDNDAAQRIKMLEEHRAGDGEKTGQTKAAVVAENGAVSATNSTVSRVAVWNVILVDLLNTPKGDLAAANKQIIQFLSRLPPGEPVALMTMSPQIKVLVPFEGGAGEAAKYLAKKGLGTSVGAPAGVRSADEDAINVHMIDPNDQNFKQIQKTTIENYARSEVELKGDRVQQSLEAFSELAERLRQYPGRKNVYWLSAGFPLQPEASGEVAIDSYHPTGAANQGGKAFDGLQQKTLSGLEKSRIAIYPVDTRGVAVADVAGETGADTEGLSASKHDAQPIAGAKSDRLEAMQRSEMLQIASQTGGVARFENDVEAALSRDFQQGQDYYSIFYTPTGDEAEGAYHSTDITVKGKGDKLFFRRGYFVTATEPADTASKGQFKLALTHGAPANAGIVFAVNVSRNGDAAEIEYAIEPRGVEYAVNAAGKLITDLDCAALEYDGRGSVIQTALIELTSSSERDRSAPLQAKQTIALKPGAASLAIGVRDQNSGAYGTVNVSVATLLPSRGEPSLARRTAPAADQSVSPIQINVVVKTKQGAPVKGLESKDFVVLDNKTPQKISDIEGPGSDTSVIAQPVQVFLLLDAVNATFEEFNYAREQTLKFLRQNGGHLEHPTVLAVWSKDGLRAQLTPTQDGNLLADQLQAANVTARTALLKAGSSDLEDFQSSLQTLEQIAENEAKVVGRKMLIWVGPGWPTLAGSEYNSSERDKQRDFAVIVDLSAELRKSQIVLYNVSLKRPEGVGARVVPPPTMNTSVSAEAPGSSGRNGISVSSGASPETYKDFLRGVRSFHDADTGNLALQVLAIQSGGRVTEPNNDIAGQIAACESDANGLYSLSFIPGHAKHENEYDELRVRVAQPGAIARATSGFYGQP